MVGVDSVAARFGEPWTAEPRPMAGLVPQSRPLEQPVSVVFLSPGSQVQWTEGRNKQAAWVSITWHEFSAPGYIHVGTWFG